MDTATTSAVAAATHPGKSGQSVGHLAKAAVAEARAAGVDLPRNAQGAAASAIAQGADPASVFAAQVVTEPDATEETAAMPTDTPAEQGPEAAYAEAGAATGGGALTSEEAALKLLGG